MYNIFTKKILKIYLSPKIIEIASTAFMFSFLVNEKWFVQMPV